MVKNFTFRRELTEDIAPINFLIEGQAFEYYPDAEKTALVQQLAAEIGELTKAVPVNVATLVQKYTEMLEIILGSGAIDLLSTALGRSFTLVDCIDLAHYLTSVLENSAKGK